MLTLGYIDHGTNELTEIAGSIEDRMTDRVNVPDPFFRMNDPIVQFEIRFVADGLVEPFPARRLIVRMNSMKEFFESRQRAGGLEPQHPVPPLPPVPPITVPPLPFPPPSLTN